MQVGDLFAPLFCQDEELHENAEGADLIRGYSRALQLVVGQHAVARVEPGQQLERGLRILRDEQAVKRPPKASLRRLVFVDRPRWAVSETIGDLQNVLDRDAGKAAATMVRKEVLGGEPALLFLPRRRQPNSLEVLVNGGLGRQGSRRRLVAAIEELSRTGTCVCELGVWPMAERDTLTALKHI